MGPCVRTLASIGLILALAVSVHAQTRSAASVGLILALVAGADSEKVRQLPIANKPWKGDFDAMLERRMIRVTVPYSRSLYFIDRCRERGLAAELMPSNSCKTKV